MIIVSLAVRGITTERVNVSSTVYLPGTVMIHFSYTPSTCPEIEKTNSVVNTF